VKHLNIPAHKIQRIVEQTPHTLPVMQHHPNKDSFLTPFVSMSKFCTMLKTKGLFASAFLLILLNGPTFTAISQT
jgi:hypothetical protein